PDSSRQPPGPAIAPKPAARAAGVSTSNAITSADAIAHAGANVVGTAVGGRRVRERGKAERRPALLGTYGSCRCRLRAPRPRGREGPMGPPVTSASDGPRPRLRREGPISGYPRAPLAET